MSGKFWEASYMTLCFARSRLAISCQELESFVCKLKAPRMRHTPCVSKCYAVSGITALVSAFASGSSGQEKPSCFLLNSHLRLIVSFVFLFCNPRNHIMSFKFSVNMRY